TLVVTAIRTARRKGLLEALGDQDRAADAPASLENAFPVALHSRHAKGGDDQGIFRDRAGVVPALLAGLGRRGNAKRESESQSGGAASDHAQAPSRCARRRLILLVRRGQVKARPCPGRSSGHDSHKKIVDYRYCELFAE